MLSLLLQLCRLGLLLMQLLPVVFEHGRGVRVRRRRAVRFLERSPDQIRVRVCCDRLI
jgi:hypothetical protein